MGREIKRVPLDFTWPLGKIWEGYLMPDHLHEKDCPSCKGGYSPHAEHLFDLWYGRSPFAPQQNGSPSFEPTHPAIWEKAERNIGNAPDYYGTGDAALTREALRLAGLLNSQWSHHLNDQDVAALLEANRLWDLTRNFTKENGWEKRDPERVPTAAEVNEWSLRHGHDALNASAVIQARCKREGHPVTCETCNGHATLEAYQGQRADADAWEQEEPPAGEGWQVWETVSEGSPITPIFETAEALARYLSSSDRPRRSKEWMAVLNYEDALSFIAAGWAPSLIVESGKSVQYGYKAVGTRKADHD